MISYTKHVHIKIKVRVPGSSFNVWYQIHLNSKMKSFLFAKTTESLEVVD